MPVNPYDQAREMVKAIYRAIHESPSGFENNRTYFKRVFDGIYTHHLAINLQQGAHIDFEKDDVEAVQNSLLGLLDFLEINRDYGKTNRPAVEFIAATLNLIQSEGEDGLTLDRRRLLYECWEGLKKHDLGDIEWREFKWGAPRQEIIHELKIMLKMV